MKEIPIIFHAGIGSLHIRMPRQQIEETINRLHTKLSLQRDSRVLIAKDLEEDGYTRYQDDAFFFMIKYEKDSAIEICVHRALRDGNHAIVTLGGMDAFCTPAKQLITELKRFSSFSCDASDERFVTNYEFSDIGIRLWREDGSDEYGCFDIIGIS